MATETTNQQRSAYDGRLFQLYTKYVSEPESKKDVYGYTLLVIGYLLAMGGMIVFLIGQTIGNGSITANRFTGVLAGAGLAFTLQGIVLLLPITRKSLLVSIVGTLISIGGVVMWSMFYPADWRSGAQMSDQTIGVYTVGVAMVAGVVIMIPILTGERSYFSETTGGHEYDHPDIAIGEAKRGGLFAVFKRGTEWSWRFIDQNAVAGSTTSFLSRLEAEERVDAVKSQVANAGLLEIKHAAFRLYESADGSWQWHLLRDDGSAVAEGGREFDARDDAEASINTIKDHGEDASVIVRQDATFDLHRMDDGWVWRLVDDDRTALAVSDETFADRSDARAALDEFRDRAQDATELLVESYGVELFEEDDSWHWRLRDSRHRHIATSTREYEDKGTAEETVYDLLEKLQDASVVREGEPTYDAYQTGDDWAWRLVDESGHAVAEGTETADSAATVTSEAREMRTHAPHADVVEIENLEFETYRDGDGWHWRLVTPEREVHAKSTETYESEDEASTIVDRVREEAPDADLIEFDNAAFQVYEAVQGTWRWRLIDEDGNVMADSGQGEYESKDDAMSAMMTLQENAPDAEHLEIENAAFELFQDDRGWGWRLVDDIGDTIADSATRHDTEEGARSAMDSLIDSVSDTRERRMEHGVFQVYADDEDEWWWRFVRADGEVLSESAQSYGTRHEIEDAIEDLDDFVGDASIEEIGRLAVLLDGDNWSWSLIDRNRDPIATTNVSYADEATVTDVIGDIQDSATDIDVYEVRDATFDCHRTDDGWTWRLIDGDHESTARSVSTYETAAALESAVKSVALLAPDAAVVDYDDLAFELYEDEDGWLWRMIDEDQHVLGKAARPYDSREEAREDLDDAREEFDQASVLEIESAAFEFHRTDDGWRWRLVDENGDELAESLATFSSRVEAQEDLTTVKDLGPDAWVSTAE